MHFQAQGNREACGTALLLTCSDQYRGTDLAMWAAQAFLLYGGEPTLSNQMQMMGRAGVAFQGQRPYINSAVGSEQRHSPQMFMSTPMPNSCAGSNINRTLDNTQVHSPYQQAQYPLSPSEYFFKKKC